MLFKNAKLYRMTAPLLSAPMLTDEADRLNALNDLLHDNPFTPCLKIQMSSAGWAPPYAGEPNNMVYSANGYTMICLKKQEKIYPPSMVAEAIEKAVRAIRDTEGRNVGRKERTQIKDEVIFDMTPTAMTKTSVLHAYISETNGLIVVNTASDNAAEELFSILRETLGSLKVVPVVTNVNTGTLLDEWIKNGKAEAEFTLGGDCTLKDMMDSGVIRYKDQDLDCQEIKDHVAGSMFVNELGLQSSHGLTFSLDTKLTVKRIKFDDMLMEDDGEDDIFHSEFVLMTHTFSVFIKSLIKVMGGVVL